MESVWWWNAMQCSAMEWIVGMQCSGVECNGCILVISGHFDTVWSFWVQIWSFLLKHIKNQIFRGHVGSGSSIRSIHGLHSIPLHCIAFHRSIPLHSTALHSIIIHTPLRSTPLHSTPSHGPVAQWAHPPAYSIRVSQNVGTTGVFVQLFVFVTIV